MIFTHYGKRYVVLHGGFSHVSQFLFPTTPDQEYINVIREIESDLGAFDGVIAGHSGIPFQKSIERVTWFNSGAIGMPAHNGISTTSYGILDACEFTIYDLSYDHQTGQDAMINAGLDQGYHTALETGYWPSEEVLPMDLRRFVDSG